MDQPPGQDAFGTSPMKGRVDDDEYAALAGLFLDDEGPLPHPALTEQANRAEPQPAIVGPPRVELLLVGHLPVLASAWIAEYARSLSASERTSVAMYRENAAHVSIDAIGLASDSTESHEFESAAGAIASLRGKVGVWLVKLTAGSTPDVPLPTDARITVLTGADEAAVVSAYRTIKSVCATRSMNKARIKVVVMGSDPASAEQAGARLRKAAESFLEQAPEIVVSSDQVTPGRSTHVYRGDCVGDLLDNLGLMTDHAPADEIEEPVVLPEAEVPEPEMAAQTEVIPEPVDVMPALPTQPEPARPTRARRPDADFVKVEVLDMPARERAAEASRGESEALASHLPNLRPIEVTCPFNDAVQIAVDTEGRLHLLTSADELEDGARDGFQMAIESLAVVRPWASSHAPLLSMATGGRVRPGREPVMHLMTSRPVGAKRLLDGDVRIHLLTRSPKHPDDWVCVDLN